MGIIECAEKCLYQKEGYCCLETLCTVNTCKGGCPHFLPISLNDGNGLTETSHTDKL